MDELIVRQAGCSISDIFAAEGEAAFRHLEAEIITGLSGVGGRVIATGGGAVLRRENVVNLSLNGRLIFLDRPPDSGKYRCLHLFRLNCQDQRQRRYIPQ